MSKSSFRQELLEAGLPPEIAGDCEGLLRPMLAHTKGPFSYSVSAAQWESARPVWVAGIVEGINNLIDGTPTGSEKRSVEATEIEDIARRLKTEIIEEIERPEREADERRRRETEEDCRTRKITEFNSKTTAFRPVSDPDGGTYGLTASLDERLFDAAGWHDHRDQLVFLPFEGEQRRFPSASEPWFITDSFEQATAILELGRLACVVTGIGHRGDGLSDRGIRLFAETIKAVMGEAGLILIPHRGSKEQANAWTGTQRELRDLGSSCALEWYVNNHKDQFVNHLSKAAGKLPIGRRSKGPKDIVQMIRRPPSAVDWLIPDLLVSDQIGYVSGPEKCLKTSVAADLAFSIATGAAFLGAFKPIRKRRVLFISAESGDIALGSLFKRISDNRRISPPEGAVSVLDDPPRLDSDAGASWLGQQVRDTRAEVVFLDPLYLLVSGEDASNMMTNGARIRQLDRVIKDAGGRTLINIHHSRAPDPRSGGAHRPGRLSDLSWAGHKEIARQWILLTRRREYAFDGEHKLWMTVGGSMGQSLCRGVDVSEGSLRSGRVWQPSVLTPEAVEEQRLKTTEAKKRRSNSKRLSKTRDAILSKLREATEPLSLNQLGARTPSQRSALNSMVAEGVVEPVSVMRNGRERAGFRATPSSIDG
ncbi:AAA family ATPase [Roseiconus lacunae]|uniref:AAA family ATPase n=1 Tax=Roseiconus lacunae TaxID=2605694 RepID=UPI0011F0D4BC|nr:AAA family ATPase [Roseiconus lacunae]